MLIPYRTTCAPQIKSVVETAGKDTLGHLQATWFREMDRLSTLCESLSKVNDPNVFIILINPVVPTRLLYQLLGKPWRELLAIAAN